MRALVTGASGFIGSNLVDRLLAEGAEVQCLVRPSSNLTWLSSPHLTLVPGDFHDSASLAPAVADVDVVFHVAGATRAARRAGYFRGNLEATCNLLQACQEYGPEDQKFLFVSSLAAAGPSPGHPLTEDLEPHPVSAYGESKLAAERAIVRGVNEGIHILGPDRDETIPTPREYIGGYRRVVLECLDRIERGEPPPIGVWDCARAVSLIHDAYRLAASV